MIYGLYSDMLDLLLLFKTLIYYTKNTLIYLGLVVLIREINK